ncbi:hypothetical protein CC2G_013578 [Coprinopsis cinerea AmutBmut pab1-1]|nr:hypothetical protein CC2G_013578 [Coprinopsis cinerea AmutBmut pab1-1]
MTRPEAQGLLYVLGEPGASVSEEEFNVWYDKDHAPLRLKVPGFQTAARYRSSDGHQPTWLAIYDLDTPEIAYSDAYKALSTNAPQYEKELIPKLEVLNRRIYRLVMSVSKPDSEVAGKGGASKYLLCVEAVVPLEADEDYNKLYEEGHLQDIVNVQGCARGRVFKLESSVELTGKSMEGAQQENVNRYVAIYEWDRDSYFDDPQLQAAASTPRTQEVSAKVTLTFKKYVLHKEFTGKE